ncbi:cAMP-dependent protein kinase inhibitor alpha [Grus japonensis]|uniref:cAMP-dependent protein kinase inhibitor alpha n=1 Tax=Grus japonensis TaxID=30415 RepID=A0ABC9WMW1_GRUJA
MGPPLKPVKIPLDGITSLQRVNRTTQLDVIGKLAEDALNPTVFVTNKDVPVPIPAPEERYSSLVSTWTSSH